MTNNKIDFAGGWEYFQKTFGGAGAFEGGMYVDKVCDAIKKLESDVSKMVYAHQNLGVDKLKGFMAEVWHGDTYNINAAVKNSKNSAKVLESTDFASVDIKVSDDGNYSLKYYKNGKDSAFEQAKTYWQRYNEDMATRRRNGNSEISFKDYLKQRNINESEINKFDSIYNGQMRLIPKDQLEAAKEFLERKIAKESAARPELVESYRETLKNLTDRIESSDGTESIPLTKDDAEKIARLAKEEGFDPSEFGISTENLIGFDEIMQQAVQSGLTAAVISCILKIAPEIYKSIDMLIKDGKISRAQFEKLGFAALSGSFQGFIRGSISAGLTVSFKAGLFGSTLKSIDPTIIGSLTVVAMNTIENSYKLATGKITKGEFAHDVSKDIFVTTCALSLGGIIQGLTPELPVLGYMLGTFIGSLGSSFLYDTGYSAFMSLCCDTGFTCFGLVEQDYKIPEDILKRAGFKLFDFTKFKTKQLEFNKFNNSKFEFKKFEYNTIRIDFLKRDVIEIAKIGYK